MKRKVLLIDDLCTPDKDGQDYLEGIQKQAGSEVEIVAHQFATRDYRVELEKVADAAKGYDAVLLDMQYDGKPLGTEIALPRLAQAGIPVILFSVEYAKREVFAQSAENLQHGRVFPITNEQLPSLHRYVEGLYAAPENFATIDHGFQFRDEEEILKRNEIQQAFQQAVAPLNSKRIEVPIIAPLSNFLGEGKIPRPLYAKDSNRLFSAISSDGTPLAVRYEGTALVAKWVASQLRNKQGENFAYHYFQEMVRVEPKDELDETHYRGFYQAGIELFSLDHTQHQRNITDTINAISGFVQSLNLRLRVRISHLDVLNKPLSEFLPDKDNKKDNKFAREKLKRVIEKETPEDLAKLLNSIDPPPRLREILMELKTIQSAKLPITRAIERLRNMGYYNDAEIQGLFDIANASEQWPDTIFDPGILRSLNFYSGITMQGDLLLADGSEKSEVFGGGEFTGMVESFGYYEGRVHSFGLAFGVERVLPHYNKS